MSWEYAARYANWLHNGKALTRDAFESGAYDTSTFTFDPDGTANHQLTHSEGALFRIPSLDEWTKGAHWDPAKNNGDGGYWRYLGASDEPLIPGSPGQGGQTNAGAPPGPAAAGSYPGVSGPWGLLDASGGVREWTDTPVPFFSSIRVVKGSSRGSLFYQTDDAIVMVDALGGIRNPSAGLRLVSAIPAPHALCIGIPGCLYLSFRRRRNAYKQYDRRGSPGDFVLRLSEPRSGQHRMTVAVS